MGGRGSSSGLSTTNGIPASNLNNGRIEKNSFFGEVKKTTNKYMVFDQVKDKDSAIIMTKNFAVVKGNPVLVTGPNTCIYLKDWQFRRMVNRDGIDAFAVKINKNYFKEYTFRSSFDFSGEKDTFESLHKVATSQHLRRQEWKSGGIVLIRQNDWRVI